VAREECRGSGKPKQDHQGCILRGAGVLFVLHNVSQRSLMSLLSWAVAQVSTVSDIASIADVCSRLLFMTYNGWVMLAVAVGAFIGYMAFGSGGATKSVACH
jgi:hypothetical protein